MNANYWVPTIANFSKLAKNAKLSSPLDSSFKVAVLKEKLFLKVSEYKSLHKVNYQCVPICQKSEKNSSSIHFAKFTR